MHDDNQSNFSLLYISFKNIQLLKSPNFTFQIVKIKIDIFSNVWSKNAELIRE